MRRWLRAALLVFLTVLAVFAVVAAIGLGIWDFVERQMYPFKTFEDFGATAAAFGDIAGVVFSALAFGGLIVATFMQRRELSLQRVELSLQRQELKQTRSVLIAQLKTERLAASLSASAAVMEHHERMAAAMPPMEPGSGAFMEAMQIMGRVALEGEVAAARARIANISRMLDELIAAQDQADAPGE